jgi:hypothetical protein
MVSLKSLQHRARGAHIFAWPETIGLWPPRQGCRQESETVARTTWSVTGRTSDNGANQCTSFQPVRAHPRQNQRCYDHRESHAGLKGRKRWPRCKSKTQRPVGGPNSSGHGQEQQQSHYHDENGLPVRDRSSLFLQICHGYRGNCDSAASMFVTSISSLVRWWPVNA